MNWYFNSGHVSSPKLGHDIFKISFVGVVLFTIWTRKTLLQAILIKKKVLGDRFYSRSEVRQLLVQYKLKFLSHGIIWNDKYSRKPRIKSPPSSVFYAFHWLFRSTLVLWHYMQQKCSNNKKLFVSDNFFWNHTVILCHPRVSTILTLHVTRP